MSAALSPQTVLLTHGGYYGTLAAARHFGRAGHRVLVADDHASPTAVSRHVATALRCPDVLDFPAMRQWLMRFGESRPGTLLYPCSDDMAWLLAAERERLMAHYRMLSPPLATIAALLDKHQLYERCRVLGIATPETHYPRDDAELVAIASRLEGRFLIKPKTQVGLIVKRKATVVDAGPALIAAYRAFRSQFRYSDALLDHDPALAWPMIQRFDPAASTHTVNIAGFRSRDGATFRVLSSRKVLQFPLRVGVGLCFEAIEVEPTLADAVERICVSCGYHGAFEVEFIESADGFLLMDFNPRYYGQMQLEISRGLPIPTLVTCDALGLPLPPPAAAPLRRIAHRWQLTVVLTAQALAGRLSWAERRRWRTLTDPRRPEVIDSVFDADDPRPWRTIVRSQWRSYLRHPRAAFRALFGSE